MEEIECELMEKTLDKIYLNNVLNPYNKSKKIIDLHTHTKYSGGELSPYELVRLGVDKKIGVLAITDNDTIDGLKNLNRNERIIVDTGIKIINGIQLSAKLQSKELHILGYKIDINNKLLNKKLEEIKDNNINSVLTLLEQIKKDYDIKFNYEDLRKLFITNHNVSSLDMAKLCVKNNYAYSIEEAYNRYLNEAKKKTIQDRKKLQYEECIELINQSGGIPVLAHPKSLRLTNKEFLIVLKEMIKYGLKGIEVYHPSHSKEDIKYYLDIALKYNLLISGGSDFYGESIKPDVQLGNNNIKKLSLLDKFDKIL